MGNNAIKQIDTKEITTPDGKAHAIFIALDIYDKKNAGAFIGEVMQKFMMHKMMSPPDTALLLITIIGDLTAKDFCAQWQALAAKDITVQTVLSMFTKADVIHGSKEGAKLDEKSLLS